MNFKFFSMRNALEASLKMEHQERDRIMNSSCRDQINGCTHIMFCINVWFSLFFIEKLQFIIKQETNASATDVANSLVSVVQNQ